jgi:hypothetical protein
MDGTVGKLRAPERNSAAPNITRVISLVCAGHTVLHGVQAMTFIRRIDSNDVHNPDKGFEENMTAKTQQYTFSKRGNLECACRLQIVS